MISCVMPTRGRPQWVAKAIKNWHQQTRWRESELVIVEDGEPASKEIAEAAGTGVRYYFLGPRVLEFGAKRNAANACCFGEVIAHWDDDDWYAAERIQEQMEMLSQPNIQVAGYHSCYFHDVRSDEVRIYQGGEYDLIDSSLMYRRSYWLENMFPPYQFGADYEFIRWARPVAKAAAGLGSMVARRHGANTDGVITWKFWDVATMADLPQGYFA